jgi:AraC-like DNA-binding protein
MANPHYHEYIEILYILSGSFEAGLGDFPYAFGSGDLVLINSQEIHTVSAVGDGPNRYAVIKFDPELLFSSEQTALELKYLLAFTLGITVQQRIFRREELASTRAAQFPEDVMREFETQAYGYEIAIRNALCQLFLWILRRWHASGVEISSVTDVNSDDLRLLQRVFDYVEGHYSEHIDVAMIASHLGMSYSTFSRFFTAHTRRFFPDYLGDVRVTKAKILLATTSKSVTDIAMEVGFSTASYFIQCFKARINHTPSQFRRRLQNDAAAGTRNEAV